MLLMFGSGCVALTVAVLVRSAAEVGRTTSVSVAVAPLGKLPRLQRTTGVPPQLPWLEFTETRMTSGENVSLRVTPDAAFGPLFVTFTVIGVFAPVMDETGAERDTATSAGVPLRSLTIALRRM